jgi:uncharacterized OB-fold protein
MENYTKLYKCNRCGKVSTELKLYCWFCGNKLYNKGLGDDENGRS